MIHWYFVFAQYFSIFNRCFCLIRLAAFHWDSQELAAKENGTFRHNSQIPIRREGNSWPGCDGLELKFQQLFRCGDNGALILPLPTLTDCRCSTDLHHFKEKAWARIGSLFHKMLLKIIYCVIFAGRWLCHVQLLPLT